MVPEPAWVGSRIMSADPFVEEMTARGHDVSEWSNGPGYEYSTHSHPYKKILCCLEGSIVFHLAGHDVPMSAGDRLELDPGTEHAASVGPAGVRCAEAHVR